MRLYLLGSGEFAVPTFEHLRRRHEVLAVVSQPDRPAGRKRMLTPTAVGRWAEEHALELRRAGDANDLAFVSEIAARPADAAVVIAFGQKLGEPLIEALGPFVINLHGSLLPRYRGAAPINWAMIRGETATGLSVIGLAQRMDAGMIYGQVASPIDPAETAGELHDRLALFGPDLVEDVLQDFSEDRLEGKVQDDSLASRAPKLTKADGAIDFNDTADAVRCRIHGLTPWPGATARWQRQEDGKVQALNLRRVEARPGSVEAAPGAVLADQCVAVQDGAVRLLEVQLSGGKAMPIQQFVHGHALTPGDRMIQQV